MWLPVAVMAALFAVSPVTGTESARSRPIASVCAENAPLRLLFPPGGTRLPAGGTVGLAWDWRGAAPPEAEEWEAFLSLDGGRTFRLRVTPHLDASVKEVTIDVPAVAAADVRLLIRYGDERDETAVELPERFFIDVTAPVALERGTSTMAVALPGERAREGDDPAVAWVDGPRNGSRRWWVESFGSESIGGRPALSANVGCAPFLLRHRRSTRGAGSATQAPSRPFTAGWISVGRPERTDAPLAAFTRLQQGCRLNE
jgi:hypothetical protein